MQRQFEVMVDNFINRCKERDGNIYLFRDELYRDDRSRNDSLYYGLEYLAQIYVSEYFPFNPSERFQFARGGEKVALDEIAAVADIEREKCNQIILSTVVREIKRVGHPDKYMAWSLIKAMYYAY